MEISATSQSSAYQKSILKHATDMEALFLHQLVTEMNKTVHSNTEKSYAHNTWQSLQSEHLASAMAESGGIGLASQIALNISPQFSALKSDAVLSISLPKVIAEHRK